MEKKISLTQKELRDLRAPGWSCFENYDRDRCVGKCSQRELRLCRKVTLFLKRR